MGDGSSSRTDTKGKGRARPNGDMLALDLNAAEEGHGIQNGPFAQMQLVEQQVRYLICNLLFSLPNFFFSYLQDDYIQQRSTAIESIESTIAELGQIFQQLAHMVAEQRETVQRIDADTIDIASNVSGAQRELLKYYASISSNRWLMLKVFGVLIVFVSTSLCTGEQSVAHVSICSSLFSFSCHRFSLRFCYLLSRNLKI